ncbi:serine O-acetyltransferase [Salinicoccus kekensis]|uniref:Serine acetyltransferase n=1 Tax=Salinicoccus kekensis TaxID=714307 RepID=A0A285USG2_9STAP|nr:DapH/DapD/GlmU-related protein [Salinicoccus kekensis]SOC44723.1 serine O-acetyltransferase [Salinicoccus kekensis]
MKKTLMNKMVNLMFKLHLLKIPILPDVINKVNRIIFSCDIPKNVSIGKDTVFVHSGLGVVVHPNAKIGSYCRIYQGVTIGGRGESGTPQIGNNVFIGANATVIGGVEVGDNAIIGAGSLVIHDVKTNSVVAGNPAKIIKQS